MAERGNLVWFILALVVLVLLAGAGATSLLLHTLGNWEKHQRELILANRIVWGSWILCAAAVLLTRATVLGWSFRRYFRWEGDGLPPAEAPRPTRAPWYKSPAASFGFTVALVSFTASVVISSAVLWVFSDDIGWPVFWLVFSILWGSWWVVCIALVLIRISIFGIDKMAATREAMKAEKKK